MITTSSPEEWTAINYISSIGGGLMLLALVLLFPVYFIWKKRTRDASTMVLGHVVSVERILGLDDFITTDYEREKNLERKIRNQQPMYTMWLRLEIEYVSPFDGEIHTTFEKAELKNVDSPQAIMRIAREQNRPGFEKVLNTMGPAWYADIEAFRQRLIEKNYSYEDIEFLCKMEEEKSTFRYQEDDERAFLKNPFPAVIYVQDNKDEEKVMLSWQETENFYKSIEPDGVPYNTENWEEIVNANKNKGVLGAYFD